MKSCWDSPDTSSELTVLSGAEMAETRAVTVVSSAMSIQSV